MRVVIIKRPEYKPKVRFSPEYMTEIDEMILEKAYLKAHRFVHKDKNQNYTIQAPKKYIDCANQLANFVMYALKLEMSFIKVRNDIEKLKLENSNEELKRWRFIYGIFERHNLNDEKELKYMED